MLFLKYQLFWNLCAFLQTSNTNVDNQGWVMHRIFYCIFFFALCSVTSDIQELYLIPGLLYFFLFSYESFPGFILNNSTLSKKNHAFPMLHLIVCPVTSNPCDLYTLHISSTMAFLLVFPLGKNTTL